MKKSLDQGLEEAIGPADTIGELARMGMRNFGERLTNHASSIDTKRSALPQKLKAYLSRVNSSIDPEALPPMFMKGEIFKEVPLPVSDDKLDGVRQYFVDNAAALTADNFAEKSRQAMAANDIDTSAFTADQAAQFAGVVASKYNGVIYDAAKADDRSYDAQQDLYQKFKGEFLQEMAGKATAGAELEAAQLAVDGEKPNLDGIKKHIGERNPNATIEADKDNPNLLTVALPDNQGGFTFDQSTGFYETKGEAGLEAALATIKANDPNASVEIRGDSPSEAWNMIQAADKAGLPVRNDLSEYKDEPGFDKLVKNQEQLHQQRMESLGMEGPQIPKQEQAAEVTLDGDKPNFDDIQKSVQKDNPDAKFTTPVDGNDNKVDVDLGDDQGFTYDKSSGTYEARGEEGLKAVFESVKDKDPNAAIEVKADGNPELEWKTIEAATEAGLPVTNDLSQFKDKPGFDGLMKKQGELNQERMKELGMEGPQMQTPT